MDTATVITLLTVNLLVLSAVIIALIVLAILLVVKMNKIATNVQQTTENLAGITYWFSPVKVFTALSRAIRSKKKK